MAARAALIALKEHWDDVLALLEPPEQRRLRELTHQLRQARTAGSDSNQADRYLEELSDFLVSHLPLRHPVRRALALDEANLNAAVAVDVEIAHLLAMLDTGEATGDTPATTAWLARQRLLSGPMYTRDQISVAGTDPDDPRLIRLVDGPGALFPAFQFDGSVRPIDVVCEVNDILLADTDPWGAASWWITANWWLGDAPSRLLGTIPASEIASAARAVLED